MKDICVKNFEENWKSDECWKGIECLYFVEKVIGLRGFIDIEYMFVRRGVEKFWNLLKIELYVYVLGVLIGN